MYGILYMPSPTRAEALMRRAATSRFLESLMRLPVSETFAGADMALYPWMSQSSNAVMQAWSLDPAGLNPPAADQNGDRGLATFHSVGEPVGTVSDFYSPMISVRGLESPALSFWMYHSPAIAGDATLEVLVSDGGAYESLGAPLRRDAAEADGWVRHTYSLAAFEDAGRLRVLFRGYRRRGCRHLSRQHLF